MKNTIKKWSLLLLFFWVGFLQAQTFNPEEQKQIDSLTGIINNSASHDTSVAAAYVNLSEILAISNMDTVIPLCVRSIAIAKKALSTHPPALEAKSLNISLSTALNNIGYVHDYQGDIPLALDYYHKSLKIDEELGNKSGMAYSYNNIGLIHFNQGDIPLALKYYHKSLNIREEIKDKRGMANSYNNIGGIHDRQGEIPLALDYYNKSLKIREEIKDKKGMAISCNNIGLIHSKQGNLTLAKEYMVRSLNIFEEINDKVWMAISYNSLASLYFEADSILEAKRMGELGLNIAHELSYPDLIERNALILTKVAQKQSNWKEAFEMHKLAIQMRDSINNDQAQKAAVEQQMKYEYEKAQALKQKEHEKQIAISTEREEKQKIISIASGGALILVIAFLLFVFNRLKITRGQKKIIEITHQKLAEHHKEIQDSIRYAKRIQEAILPSMAAIHNAVKDGFLLYKPKDVVAGDFYWLEQNDEKIYIASADCTGHGVPGAMVSVVCSNALSKSLMEEKAAKTGELLDKTREIVIQRLAKNGEEVKDGMDISLCAIDFERMNMQWSGANNPLWIVRKGEIIEYKHDKQPIGMHYNIKPFTTHEIELQKNDLLYLFTDGYQDQFDGSKGKKFRASQLKEKLLSIQHQSMDEQKVSLDTEFENWKGQNEQIDDVCIIGVRIS